MNYSQFVKLLCLLVVMGLGFLSVASQAQEATPDPQYPSYMEAIKKSLQEKPTAKAVEMPKQPREDAVERICLENGSCLKKDFSDYPHGIHLFDYCTKYVDEYQRGKEPLSNEAQICVSFLFGFSQALIISSYVSFEKDGMDRDLINFGKCSASPNELYPEAYVRFMRDRKELLKKNAYYGAYIFFQNLFECKLVEEK